MWFFTNCFVPPNIISHIFLAEEVFLIIHLNSQNISLGFEEVTPLLAMKCVHLQVKILI